METPLCACVCPSVRGVVSAAVPFAGFSWHLIHLPLRIVVDVQEFSENQHREGHTCEARPCHYALCCTVFIRFAKHSLQEMSTNFIEAA